MNQKGNSITVLLYINISVSIPLFVIHRDENLIHVFKLKPNDNASSVDIPHLFVAKFDGGSAINLTAKSQLFPWSSVDLQHPLFSPMCNLHVFFVFL